MSQFYKREAGEEGGIVVGEDQAPGVDLSTVLNNERPPPRVALEIVIALCDVLWAADEDSQVHGDIKPGYVRLEADGSVSIEGFGDARKGGRAPDPQHTAKTDVYGLGVVLYSLLSDAPLGRVPKDGDGHDDAIVDRLQSVDFGMDSGADWNMEILRLLAACLAWDPAERGAPQEVADVLFGVTDGLEGDSLKDWAAAAVPASGGDAFMPKGPKQAEDLGGPATGAANVSTISIPVGEVDQGGPSTAFWSRDKLDELMDEVEEGAAPEPEPEPEAELAAEATWGDDADPEPVEEESWDDPEPEPVDDDDWDDEPEPEPEPEPEHVPMATRKRAGPPPKPEEPDPLFEQDTIRQDPSDFPEVGGPVAAGPVTSGPAAQSPVQPPVQAASAAPSAGAGKNKLISMVVGGVVLIGVAAFAALSMNSGGDDASSSDEVEQAEAAEQPEAAAEDEAEAVVAAEDTGAAEEEPAPKKKSTSRSSSSKSTSGSGSSSRSSSGTSSSRSTPRSSSSRSSSSRSSSGSSSSADVSATSAVVGAEYRAVINLNFEGRTKIQCFGSGYSAEFLGTTTLTTSGTDTCVLKSDGLQGSFQVKSARTVTCEKAGSAIMCD